MKFCPRCGASMEDNAGFCPQCGTNTATNAPANKNYDHTAEFSAEEVAAFKSYAMLSYLLGLIGVVIALLAGRDSAYLQFHIRQIIKFTVVNTLLGIVAAVLFFTIIIPIAAGIFAVVLTVIQIISFFRVCSGKSVEPEIIRSFGFLK